MQPLQVVRGHTPTPRRLLIGGCLLYLPSLTRTRAGAPLSHTKQVPSIRYVGKAREERRAGIKLLKTYGQFAAAGSRRSPC